MAVDLSSLLVGKKSFSNFKKGILNKYFKNYAAYVLPWPIKRHRDLFHIVTVP